MKSGKKEFACFLVSDTIGLKHVTERRGFLLALQVTALVGVHWIINSAGECNH